MTSGGAGNKAQFPRRNPGFIQLSSLQKQSLAWENKCSRGNALHRVLTKQKLKGTLRAGNCSLHGIIPKRKVEAKSEEGKCQDPRDCNLDQTLHMGPANYAAGASFMIMFPCNQSNCDNSSGWIHKTGIYNVNTCECWSRQENVEIHFEQQKSPILQIKHILKNKMVLNKHSNNDTIDNGMHKN